MTRPAVRNRPPRNELVFPLNVRESIAAWKKLYFHPGVYQPDPAHDAQWNRGKYLTDGLGHCSACHSPRNKLQAEERGKYMDGGDAEGWHAYAINARSAAPEAWTVEALREYLQRGWTADHGVARGPMAGVTRELADASDADVRAMAVYVRSLMDGARHAPARPRPVDDTRAARIYRGACADCHDHGDPLPFGGIAMERSIGLSGENPRNLANVILYGLPAAQGQTSPVMPGYAGALTDDELAELMAWLRARYTDQPPWPDVAEKVREARKAGEQAARESAGGTGANPARVAEGR
jgi:mono/diheme cytochrome c family protein